MSDAARRIAALSPEQRDILLRELARARQGGPAPVPATLPPLAVHPAARHEPFPLTGIQEVYWAGRSGCFDLPTSGPGANVYMEYEIRDGGEPFLQRLEEALRRLFDRHEILRLIVFPDGSQRMLDPVPAYRIERVDLRSLSPSEAEAASEETRERFRYYPGGPGTWPLFGFRASFLADGRVRLHIWLDCWLIDGLSRDNLIRDLFVLLADPAAELPPLGCTYRDYALWEKEVRGTEVYRRSREHWLRRLPDLPPPPELPLAMPLSPRTPAHFTDRDLRLLEADQWQRFQAAAQRLGATPSLPLIAAFIEVLRAWIDRPAFLLALEGTYWPPVHPQLRELVGNFNTVYVLAADDLAGSFAERVQRLQRQLSDVLDNRVFSGYHVLRELRRRRGGGTSSLLPVNFNSLIEYNHPGHARGEGPAPPLPAGPRVAQIELGIHPPQILLVPSVYEGGGAIFLKTQSIEGVLPDGLTSDLIAAYVGLVRRLAEGGAVWDSQVFSLVPAAQLASRAGATAAPALPPGTTLHGLFAARLAECPDALALSSAAGPLTRRELEEWAARLARQLRDLGAVPGEPVAVAAAGAQRAAGLLAALASGSACLPVDPSWPAGTLRGVLRQSGARYALASADSRELLEKEGVRCLAVEPPDGRADEEIDLAAGAGGLAWIVPAGEPGDSPLVEMDHWALAALLADLAPRLGIGPGDRLLPLSPAGTDLSLFEILAALTAGATVTESIADATVWSATPALLDRFLARLPDGDRPLPLRLALLHRGTVPLNLPGRLRALAPAVRVAALAGTPETGIAALHEVDDMPSETIRLPLGRPLAGVSFHVLDHAGEPRPDWVPGELWIGGPGLARGYRGDDAATRERFPALHGERLFRTGLRARFLPGGIVERLGRDDEYRVEIAGRPADPRWSEAALERHPEVRAAAVRQRPDARGRNRLEAWLVPAAGAAAGELAGSLRILLPSYL
ncbi:MAG TPA: AMP-binding protein, partial [Thermoanaerobaculia bacterium]|nr:AMP-binding protein [Thermoanaerobaculia bacterium]